MDEVITEANLTLPGQALKLSTFKVGESFRGRKIGELFLKAAFRHATLNRLENIFIHGDATQHQFLFELLEDFGFSSVGTHPGSAGRDLVYLKKHPASPPENLHGEVIEPFEYLRRYFPHFLADASVRKYAVPIQPDYHRILFPDYSSPADRQLALFDPTQGNPAGNAIKLAYLCHSQTKSISSGDIVFFYRSGDEKAITSLGVVEAFRVMTDADQIARLVSRRTVYTMAQIRGMAEKETRVMLFRLVRHFTNPPSHGWLKDNEVVSGNIQSIREITDEGFRKILAHEAR
jgi:hypothetical protein